MALVRPITNATIVDFVRADGRDLTDIADIVRHLTPVDFSSVGRQGWITAFTTLLVNHYDPAYAPIVLCLFIIPSSYNTSLRTFATKVVEQDRGWIISFLDATRKNYRGIQVLPDAKRRIIIEALIYQYIAQYDNTDVGGGMIVKNTIDDLIRLLENCRTNNDPAKILYAVETACSISPNNDVYDAVVTKYRGEADYLRYLTNGVIKSTNVDKFAQFNTLLYTIGTIAPIVKLDGTPVADGVFPELKWTAAYSLTPLHLTQVLANIADVPELDPYLQPIRDAIAAVTVDSVYPPVFTGPPRIPPHYIQLVTGGPPPKTFAERAVEEGNNNLVVLLIVAGVNLADSDRLLMPIALKAQKYTIAQLLWGQNNSYPDVWFPPNFVFDEKKLFAETNDGFRKDFAAKYAVSNPGWAGFYTTVGRAVRSGPAYTGPALGAVAQEEVADNVISILNGMPDFVPNNSDKTTIDLKKLSTIRDELQRLVDPAVWNSKMLLPLIAKKGACAFGVVLPNADLIKTAISVGADPNVVDADGKAALHYLTKLDVKKEYARLRTPRAILMLKSLLTAANLNINLPVGPDRDTALHLVLGKGEPSKEFLELLSRVKGIDFDALNAAGDSPLHHLIKTRATYRSTVLKESDYAIKSLADRVDMKILDANRHTALWVAIDTVTDDEYLASIIPLLAKGLTDTAVEATLIEGKPGLPISARILKSLVPVLSGPPLIIPDWVPDNIKTILAGDSLDLSAKDVIMRHIVAVDAYINNGTPSEFDSLMDLLKSRYGPPSMWESFRQKVAPNDFTVTFNDVSGSLSSIRLLSPYAPGAAYRDLPTTVYNASGTPTLAAGTDPAAVTAAARNNDVLVKLVGRQYITLVHQSTLKKILKELYHADANPSLGNDMTTLITNLFMKFETMEKADKAIQKHGKAKALGKLEPSLTTFVGSLITGGRFPSSIPDALPFPAIAFTGLATHAPLFSAAAAVAGGGIPMMPGLRAARVVPPPRGGLRAVRFAPGTGGGGGTGGVPGSAGPPPVLINTITGEPIDPRILATDFPTVVTLGSDDALTYATPPVTTANGFEVSRSDSFYKFLQPFGLTAVFSGKAYILRPAELFLALFHKTQPQIAAVMRDRAHPIVTLLRDVCLPAAIQLAQRKGMTDSVTKLRVLVGKLPR